MTPRTIPIAAFGTYYAVGASAAHSTKNAKQARSLYYQLKNNRNPPVSAVSVRHSKHPRGEAAYVTVSVKTAPTYFAELFSTCRDALLAKVRLAGDPVLVPIPSSEATAARVEQTRWPALRAATEMEKRGLGRVRVVVVNKQVVESKSTSKVDRPYQTIAANYELIEDPPISPILLVDDSVTHGHSTAAMDLVLGNPANIAVMAFMLTDSLVVEDALRPRVMAISYDHANGHPPIVHSPDAPPVWAIAGP